MSHSFSTCIIYYFHYVQNLFILQTGIPRSAATRNIKAVFPLPPFEKHEILDLIQGQSSELCREIRDVTNWG